MPLPMYIPKEQRPLSGVANIIAVAAGKGGVGKSTATVNLAHALKRCGYSVGVLDADVYGPSIRRMLPEDTMPMQKNDRFYPAISHGIKTMSLSFFRRDNESTAVRAPVANGIITQFLTQVEWGVLDYLLIDFPPGTGDIQLTLAQKGNISGAVMVTTPQEVALLDVRKAAHMFLQVNIPLVGVVENMSYYQPTVGGDRAYLFGRGGGHRLAAELGVPFLGEIPIDPEICRCGDEGIPLPGDNSAFASLAKSVVAHVMALKRNTPDALPSFDLQWKDL